MSWYNHAMLLFGDVDVHAMLLLVDVDEYGMCMDRYPEHLGHAVLYKASFVFKGLWLVFRCG